MTLQARTAVQLYCLPLRRLQAGVAQRVDERRVDDVVRLAATASHPLKGLQKERIMHIYDGSTGCSSTYSVLKGLLQREQITHICDGNADARQ